MNDRERLLSIGIGAVVALVLGYFGWSYVSTQFEQREAQLATLQRDVKKKKQDEVRAKQAARRLADYEAQSLPPDIDLAKSHYQTWLLKTVEDVKLQNVKMTTLAPRQGRNTFQRLNFAVVAEGDMKQAVDFLYRFHSMDWLHRIDNLTLRPIPNTKKVVVGATISALAVNAAPKSDTLKPRVDKEFTTKPLAYYLDPILARSKFHPPNQPPRIDVASKSTAYLTKSFETTIKSSDPDPLDKVQLSLIKNSEPPARFDPRSGKLSWNPTAKGSFTFEVSAVDDSYPPQTKTQSFTINVEDPPPPPKPMVVEKKPDPPSFDHSKHTYLTAVLFSDEDSEAWLSIRTKGELVKLHVGEAFQIGTVKAEVAEINDSSVTLNVGGKTRIVGKGANLFEAVALPTDTN